MIKIKDSFENKYNLGLTTIRNQKSEIEDLKRLEKIIE